jgi:hypothetical protein
MNEETWVVDAPSAVSEVIDGELVVMNLATGNYFSGAGVGATLWSCFERALPEEAALAEVLATYEVDRDRLQADFAEFTHTLQGHGLLRRGPAKQAGTPMASSVRQPYDAPTLTLYTDMKDLLMLDPIHDVAEEGWPTRPADHSAH